MDSGVSETLFPFRPRDWVMDQSGRVATVKEIRDCDGEILFDLVMYDHSGGRLGRVSPALGGPRTFEPMCSIDGWERVAAPTFPMVPKWVNQPDGTSRAMYWSNRLPPANWRKPKPKAAKLPSGLVKDIENDHLRQALEKIANGDNDPRATAREALGWPRQGARPQNASAGSP